VDNDLIEQLGRDERAGAASTWRVVLLQRRCSTCTKEAVPHTETKTGFFRGKDRQGPIFAGVMGGKFVVA
jgi:hypothetical protein